MRTTLAVLALVCTAASAQSGQGKVVPVTADNFTRAESDKYFADVVKDAGGLGRFRERSRTLSS